MDAHGFRAGFVALVGLPNVGKSTLLNCLVGESLGIVTAKAQTTRRRLRGIYTTANHQAVFVDTPGLLEPRYALQASMQQEALDALAGAEVLLAIVDAGFGPSIEWAEAFTPPVELVPILCLNKIDRIEPDELARLDARLDRGRWPQRYATRAHTCTGVDALRDAVLAALPPSPPLYPRDELSDAPVRDFVAERIRESCFEELGQELPYAIAVTIEAFKEREGDRPTYIEAWIHVERESQKGMVIGSGGKMIRRIGSSARRKIETFLDQRVYLELRVKVLANWRKRDSVLRSLGYPAPRHGPSG